MRLPACLQATVLALAACGALAFAPAGLVQSAHAQTAAPARPAAPSAQPSAPPASAPAAAKPPVLTRAFWAAEMRKPLEARYGTAPQALVDYLIIDNRNNGFAARPRAAKITPDFKRDVEQAFRDMPAAVKRALAPKFAGLYFVDDLGSTGWTEALVDESGKQVAAVIVLDMGVLMQRSANAWSTWKESTPFIADARWRIDARIAMPAEDNRKYALQYILLHEVAHAIAVNTRLHPWPDIAPQVAFTQGPWTWLDLTWSAEPSGWVSRYDNVFPNRARIVYYTGAKLPAAQMQQTYEQLRNTSFATLYAATNPMDDFAEAFANYVHTQVLNRPFAIRIYRDGKPVLEYRDCWEEQRCAQKRRMVEEVLGIRRK